MKWNWFTSKFTFNYGMQSLCIQFFSGKFFFLLSVCVCVCSFDAQSHSLVFLFSLFGFFLSQLFCIPKKKNRFCNRHQFSLETFWIETECSISTNNKTTFMIKWSNHEMQFVRNILFFSHFICFCLSDDIDREREQCDKSNLHTFVYWFITNCVLNN